MSDLHDDLNAMSRAVGFLALEVPEKVWEDVHAKWQAVADHIDRLEEAP